MALWASAAWGRRSLDDALPHNRYRLSRHGEGNIECGYLLQVRARFLEEHITRAERLFEVPQLSAVTGINLRAGEIQEPAARFSADPRTMSASRFEKNTTRPSFRYSLAVLLLDRVDRQFLPLWTKEELQVTLVKTAVQKEAGGIVPNRFGERRNAGRLQAQHNADGLKERRFALGIRATDDSHAGSKLRVHRGKTSKLPELEC